MGLVSQVFNESALNTLTGPHRRRPLPLLHHRRLQLAERPAHPRPHRLRHRRARPQRQPDQHRASCCAWCTSATRKTTANCGAATPRTPPWSPRCSPATWTTPSRRRRWRCCPRLRGAFCFVFMDETTLYAARDPQGVRPLVLGRLERGWVVASETAALDIVGASFVREVEPGELIAIDENGLRTKRFAAGEARRMRLRVRLPGPSGHHHRRPQRARGPRGDGPPAGRGASGRGRPGHPGAGVRHARRDRLRGSIRNPLRAGAREERLRRTHLHPALPDAAPARHQAQAQPARAT